MGEAKNYAVTRCSNEKILDPLRTVGQGTIKRLKDEGYFINRKNGRAETLKIDDYISTSCYSAVIYLQHQPLNKDNHGKIGMTTNYKDRAGRVDSEAKLKPIIACNKFSPEECMAISNDVEKFLKETRLYHEELPTSLNALTENGSAVFQVIANFMKKRGHHYMDKRFTAYYLESSTQISEGEENSKFSMHEGFSHDFSSFKQNQESVAKAVMKFLPCTGIVLNESKLESMQVEVESRPGDMHVKESRLSWAPGKTDTQASNHTYLTVAVHNTIHSSFSNPFPRPVPVESGDTIDDCYDKNRLNEDRDQARENCKKVEEISRNTPYSHTLVETCDHAWTNKVLVGSNEEDCTSEHGHLLYYLKQGWEVKHHCWEDLIILVYYDTVAGTNSFVYLIRPMCKVLSYEDGHKALKVSIKRSMAAEFVRIVFYHVSGGESGGTAHDVFGNILFSNHVYVTMRKNWKLHWMWAMMTGKDLLTGRDHKVMSKEFNNMITSNRSSTLSSRTLSEARRKERGVKNPEKAEKDMCYQFRCLNKLCIVEEYKDAFPWMSRMCEEDVRMSCTKSARYKSMIKTLFEVDKELSSAFEKYYDDQKSNKGNTVNAKGFTRRELDQNTAEVETMKKSLEREYESRGEAAEVHVLVKITNHERQNIYADKNGIDHSTTSSSTTQGGGESDPINFQDMLTTNLSFSGLLDRVLKIDDITNGMEWTVVKSNPLRFWDNRLQVTVKKRMRKYPSEEEKEVCRAEFEGILTYLEDQYKILVEDQHKEVLEDHYKILLPKKQRPTFPIWLKINDGDKEKNTFGKNRREELGSNNATVSSMSLDQLRMKVKRKLRTEYGEKWKVPILPRKVSKAYIVDTDQEFLLVDLQIKSA